MIVAGSCLAFGGVSGREVASEHVELIETDILPADGRGRRARVGHGGTGRAVADTSARPGARPWPNDAPGVSVIIPAVHERGLARAVRSVLVQDYDGPVEVAVADGSGAPAVGRTARSLPGVRTVANPGRWASAGLNRALAATAYPVVVRCDVHTELAPDYVRTAVATLLRTGAAVVGGRQAPLGETPFGRAVAVAMATRLGSGGACR